MSNPFLSSVVIGSLNSLNAPIIIICCVTIRETKKEENKVVVSQADLSKIPPRQLEWKISEDVRDIIEETICYLNMYVNTFAQDGIYTMYEV